MEKPGGNLSSGRMIAAAKVEFESQDRQWIAERMQEILASGQLTLGTYGAEFETEFAAFCGVSHGVAVSSGTAALEIIFRTLEVDRQDVLVPSNTNFATVEALIRAGANPVLMDTDPESFATTPEEVEHRITPGTTGMVVVHIGGIVSRHMRRLQTLAQEKGIWIVEDAAHAHGSSYDNIKAGAFGVAAAFSFYPTKVMTSAEGGMIVSNDEHIAEEARIYRDQGKSSFTRNLHSRHGYNWRLSEPHAIIGLAHLRRLPEMLAARNGVAAIYDQALRGGDLVTPLAAPAGGISNYYKYIVLPHKQVDRKAIKARLRKEYMVELPGEVYEVPIHQQPIFREFARHPLPVTDDLCARHLCLPISATMPGEETERVVAALTKVLGPS